MENRPAKSPDTHEVPGPNQEASSSQEPPQAVDSPSAPLASSPNADEILPILKLESANLKPSPTATPVPASTPVGSSHHAHVLATPAKAISKQLSSTDLESDQSAAAATTTTTTTEPLKLKSKTGLETVQVETSNRNISDEQTKPLPHDEDSKWWILKFLVELTLFLALAGIFVAVLASNVLQDTRIWNLGAWRMCMLLFLVLSGWIVAKWVMDAVVFLVDVWADRIKNRQEKVADADRITNHQEKVAYLIRGLKGSVTVFIWVAAILVSWIFLFRHEVEIIPEHVNEDLDKVTRALAATLVGIFLWIWKSLLMQILAWSFIVTRSKPAVERNCKDQKQVRTLWDHARAQKKDQKQQADSGSGSGASKPGLRTRSQLYVVNMLNMLLNAEGETGPGRKILGDEYKEIKSIRRNWTPRCLLLKITDTELPVFVKAEKGEHISVERAARATADQLFKKIAKKFELNHATEKGGEVKYITTIKRKDDQNVLTIKEEQSKRLLEKLEEVIPLIKLHLGGNTHRFRRSDFRKWMINVYKKRMVLIRTINGRDNVIGELNRVTSCAAILIILIVWLLIMGSLTTQVMIAIATQIMALKFIFDDTAKTAFESIMFVFSTRPFDVGDPCEVGDEKMVVHDMNILSTIFKRDDGEMLYYPNSSLIGKTLINFCSRGDTSGFVEFKINRKFIDVLKKEIETYLNNENKVWNIKECVMKVKKDENDKNKQLIILKLNHRVDFYKGGDKKTNRDDLVEKIKKIIKKLKNSPEPRL